MDGEFVYVCVVWEEETSVGGGVDSGWMGLCVYVCSNGWRIKEE